MAVTLVQGQVHVLFARRAFPLPATMAFLLFERLEQFAAAAAFMPQLAEGSTLGAAGFPTDGFSQVQFKAGFT